MTDPDPAWPRQYDRLAGRIREALGWRVLELEHVGSTSVPAIILIIAESAWVLAAAGVLVISPKPASGPPVPAQPLPRGTGSRTSASPP